MKPTPEKYGLKFDEPSPKHWVFGSSSIPLDIIQEDRNWGDSLPVKEFQNLNNIEPYACVIFTTLNCVEILINKKYGIERNYSDRFLATLADTRNNQGSAPDEVGEMLRNLGVPPQETWPFDETINTVEKFFSPISPEVLAIAKEFLAEWDFNHDFVPPNHDSISRALQCSPLLISVSAWFRNSNDRYYRPQGMTDNHATTLFAEREDEYMRVFDSYDSPHIKDVEWNDIPMVVKRFWIKKKIENPKIVKSSLWQRIFLFFHKLYAK